MTNRPEGRVKPLEWRQVDDNYHRSIGVLGNYHIYYRNGLYSVQRIDRHVFPQYETLKKAKAAAQKHYYRILAKVLEPVDEQQESEE